LRAAGAALGLRSRNAQRHDGVHGTAHWADRAEIEATCLLPLPGRRGAGVYVGGWLDERGRLHYLRHDGPEHIAAIAPTRSGKGVALIVPTLLSWPHSLVVNDQKAELWHLTAGWRESQAGNAVLRFDPSAETGSVAFNPLEEIRLGTLHEVGDVQNLVTILVDAEGKGLIDHWAKTSHAFLTGAILHVLYRARATGGVGALPQVALALSDPVRPVDALYREMLDNKWAGGNTHPTIAAAARDMTNRPDEERGSVLSTATSPVALPRPADRQERLAQRFPHHGSDESRKTRFAVSGGARRGQGPPQTPDAADHQPAGAGAAAAGNHLCARPAGAAA
jgi:type IV secretion system protein VirD4